VSILEMLCIGLISGIILFQINYYQSVHQKFRKV
jgi:hypothetical protein